jgi:hypothetical protein
MPKFKCPNCDSTLFTVTGIRSRELTYIEDCDVVFTVDEYGMVEDLVEGLCHEVEQVDSEIASDSWEESELKCVECGSCAVPYSAEETPAYIEGGIEYG